jgi:predicted nucleic acid-binding protein
LLLTFCQAVSDSKRFYSRVETPGGLGTGPDHRAQAEAVTVVSNASPLITLSKVGALHILPELFGKLIVATEVFHEVTVIGAGRPGASDVQGASWIEVKSYTNAAQFARWRTQYGLGAGETATILLAQESSANLAIMDERTARGAFCKLS